MLKSKCYIDARVLMQTGMSEIRGIVATMNEKPKSQARHQAFAAAHPKPCLELIKDVYLSV